ncbi:MAG: PAS domain-containing protein [Acidobacteria bacterium]|nr:PAS domain-containing protein [Acidobacteriota bacterium]
MSDHPHPGLSSTNIEEALAQSFRDVATAAGAAIYICDFEWKLVFANELAFKLTDVRPKDVGKRILWELYPDIVGTALETMTRRVMDERVTIEQERFYYPRRDAWRQIKIFPVAAGIAVLFADVTEMVRAEQERERATAELQQVMDSTTDAVVWVARDWHITFMNARATELLAPAGDLTGKLVWEAFANATHEDSPFRQSLLQAMERRVYSDVQVFFGEPLNRWFHLMIHPGPTGIVVIFRDITELKKRDEALRASEERYRVLTELSPQAQWAAAPDGSLIYANRRFLEYVGRQISPRSGKEYIEFFDPADRQMVLQRWHECLRTGEDFEIEARLLRSGDGTSRWCRLKASPVRNERGEIEQWLGIASDIHKARVAEAQLRAQYEQLDKQSRMLKAIYAGSPIGMALYEPTELRVLNLNERQAAILGISPEEAIGKRFDELVPNAIASLGMLQRAAKGEPMLNQMVEGTLPSRPNDYRYWNINYSPIFADDGSVTAIAGATVEITQQKRAEAALIQNEKLAAVGRLAASISHEINNPLEAITNLLYLSSAEDLPEAAQDYVHMAQEELKRVSQIATQTLRFHRQSENAVYADPAQMLDAVMNLYQGRLVNSGIRVERRYRATGRVRCFENDIRQVLNNLIANAIDAMRGTGGRLSVSTENRSGNDGESGIAITVADTGHGMSRETQERLFEPFFTTKGINGTGLGLWISRSLVERHHGRLKVRSRAGERVHGTVFQLFLPCESGNAATEWRSEIS